MNIQNRRPSQPPLDERVERLLDAAAAPTEPGRVPGEDEALVAFRASQDVLGRTPMRTHLISAKTAAAAALSVGLLVTGGAAAAGALPDQAQDAARDALASVGIEVPAAHENAGDNPERRGPVERTEEEPEVVEVPEEDGEAGDPQSEHGKAVSEMAQEEYDHGRDRGAAVSELASSKSHGNAEENRPETPGEGAGKPDDAGAPAEGRKPAEPGSSTDAPPADKPPVEAPPEKTPNEGGNADIAPPVEEPAPEGGAETGEKSAQDGMSRRP